MSKIVRLLVAFLVALTANAFVPSTARTVRSSQLLFKNPTLSNSDANDLKEASTYSDREIADIEDSSMLEQSWMEMPKESYSLKQPVHRNVCPHTGITLSRFMMDVEHLNPELREVESIFTSIQVACKAISKLVRTASLQSNTGLQAGGGSINVQGEEQKKMDILANDILKNALGWAGKLKTIASEEDDTPVATTGNQRHYQQQALIDSGASYIAVFDPLDGSSNIDAGIPVGTIFGIFEHDAECSTDVFQGDECFGDVLQPGNKLVAAGYCLYSSATTLVMTLGGGSGTHGFTLDESIGEFVLTHCNMKIPERGNVYSFNEGNRFDWDKQMQDYITNLQKGTGETKTKYSGRYVGSMVADIHRTLQYGGIFGYPADKRNVDGKLRLLYEAAPMAMLIEEAGGIATTGSQAILDILPAGIHVRVPCILGSKEDVKELQSYYQKPEQKKRASPRDRMQPAFFCVPK